MTTKKTAKKAARKATKKVAVAKTYSVHPELESASELCERVFGMSAVEKARELGIYVATLYADINAGRLFTFETRKPSARPAPRRLAA